MLQLTSTVKDNATLEIGLSEVEKPVPGPDDVLIEVQATPINPSDLGTLIGAGDVTTIRVEGEGVNTKLIMDVPQSVMWAMKPRIDKPMPVGNEGAGIVVDAGDNVKHLIGKVVSGVGGGMYAQYRVLPAMLCIEFGEGITPRDCASSFVNPLTALGMVETMKSEGHAALIHTAAASNLGQMLVKICKADGIDLINIVRKSEQVELLKSLGAKYICNSSDENFKDSLVEAIKATNATLAFDATGGGDLSGKILSCMEIAARANMTDFSPYGSTKHKQVYIYGALNQSGISFPNNRSFGMYWGIGGWLLTPFLANAGMDKNIALRQRVANEILTTFNSTYTKEISLSQALSLEEIMVYAQTQTGRKYLINPSL
ncbi:MAG: zinc-binding dehydrogenase [Gammaproteobacteria bacterium]